MSDAATPAATAPAVAPAATPAKPPESETVTLTKAEHEQLSRDAARAASAQSRADRYAQALQRGGGTFQRAATAKPTEPVKPEDREAQAIEEDRKASTGLLALAIDPAFREVLDADPTLRGILTSNPLAVLPLLAPDALDAEDAIDLVKAKLQERLASIKKPETKPNEAAPTAPAAPITPPAGGVNMNAASVDEAYEAAKKLTNTESAVSEMVKTKLKKFGTGKS